MHDLVLSIRPPEHEIENPNSTRNYIIHIY